MNATATSERLDTPLLSPQAVLALGLAGISLPFCDSVDAEVDRWLRILRLRGRTGRVLQALGVGETSLRQRELRKPTAWHRRSSDDVIALVSAAAVEGCRARNAGIVETDDILVALMKVYGQLFEEALQAHGTSCDEVLSRLALVS
jgi:hypothetical protein